MAKEKFERVRSHCMVGVICGSGASAASALTLAVTALEARYKHVRAGPSRYIRDDFRDSPVVALAAPEEPIRDTRPLGISSLRGERIDRIILPPSDGIPSR